MACLAVKEGARRARKKNGLDRCRQAAGGAWLGAGPAGERKIDGVRTVSTRCARRSTRKPWAAGRRAARERYPSTRCEAASADPDGALGAAQVAARFVYAEEVTAGKAAVGQFEAARLEKTRDTYTQYLELKRKVPLEEIYTNDLLPEKK